MRIRSTIAFLFVFLILPLIAAAGQTGSASTLPVTAAQPVPAEVQRPAGPADWLHPDHGPARSNYNDEETQLVPPLSQNIPASFALDPFAESNRGEYLLSPVLVAGETLYAVYANYHDNWTHPVVRAYDTGGSQLWEYGNEEFNGGIDQLTVEGDTVLLRYNHSTDPDRTDDDVLYLVGLNRHNGAVRWQREMQNAGGFWYLNNLNSGAYFVPDGDTVYLLEGTAEDHVARLVALDITTGDQQWASTIDTLCADCWPRASDRFTTRPVIAGGHLFAAFSRVASSTENEMVLAAFSLADGSEQWRTRFPNLYDSTTLDHLIAAGDHVVFSENGHMTAFNMGSGDVAWQWGEETCSGSSADTLAADGALLLLARSCEYTQGWLGALDLTSGTLSWSDGFDTGDELIWEMPRDMALANDRVFVSARTVDNTGGDASRNFIQVRDLATGDVQQEIEETTSGSTVSHLSIANGRLYGAGGRASFTDTVAIVFVWDSLSGRYLLSYDTDDDALTNPMAGDPAPIVNRDGVRSTVVEIGASVHTEAVTQTATLRIYHPGGAVYKEAAGEPDRFGNAYWSAPLAYSADGYEYDVELGDGTLLPRRQIEMDDEDTFIHDSDGLQWVNPPATVFSLPATLSLSLPAGFPAPGGEPTEALLFVRGAAGGACFIRGERNDDTISFTLTTSNIVDGAFTLNAVARAGNVTAHSPPHDLDVTDPNAFDTMPCVAGAVGVTASGRSQITIYGLEREAPAPAPLEADEVGIEAEVLSVVPSASGVEISLRVRTPPGPPPDDPNPDPIISSRWPVRFEAQDENGRSVGGTTIHLEPGTDGVVRTSVTQNGAASAGQVAVYTPVRAPQSEPDPSPTPPPIPPPSPPSFCAPPPPGEDPPDDDDDEIERLFTQRVRLADVISWNASAGVQGGATAALGTGVNVGGQAYGQYNLLSGAHQYCAEGSLDVGGNAGYGLRAEIGPKLETGFELNLDPYAPASAVTNAKKHYVAGSFLGGFELSYTEPLDRDGFGSLGASLGVGAQAELTAGTSRVVCYNPDPQDPPPPPADDAPRCCDGMPCPPPPGGDHPDDTMSVVLQNLAQGATAAAEDSAVPGWEHLAQQARGNGYGELATYADWRAELAAFWDTIRTFPAGEPVTPEQAEVFEAYHYTRLLRAPELGETWPTVLAQAQLMSERGTAAVLYNGYYEETMAMLGEYGIRTRGVRPDFSPAEVDEQLLIIPTAGLYGLNDIDGFRDRLQAFVFSGGRLLVLAQQGVDAWQALPGSVSGVGYQDDVSCYADAMTMLAQHPMLASLSDPSVTSHVDGYLTGLPAQATMLMERTKNEEGAFALYEFGDGQVIVTNMYDDWGRTVGQSSPEVRAIFRDMVRWAMMGEQIVEATPNSTATVPLVVKNESGQNAAAIRYLLRQPDGGLVPFADDEVPAFLLNGQSTAVQPTVPTGSTLGIWLLNYELLDAGGDVIQNETTGAIFTVHDPTVTPAVAAFMPTGPDNGRASESGATPTGPTAPLTPENVSVTVTTDKAAYSPGETVDLQLDVTFTGSSLPDTMRVIASLGETTREQVVSAEPSQTLSFSLPADFGDNGLLFYGVYDDDTGQGLLLDTQWLTQAGQEVTVLTEQKRYAPGDTVNLTIESSATLTTELEGPGGYRETMALTPGTHNASFQLPEPFTAGAYSVRYYDGDQILRTRFDVAGPQIQVKSLDTPAPTADAGDTITLEAVVESNAPRDVVLEVEIVKPEGSSSTVAQAASLAAGEQTVAIDAPFAVASTGMARFELTVYDAQDTTVSYARTSRYLTVSAPEMLALRTPSATTDPGHVPTVLLDWYNPAGEARSLAVELYLDGDLAHTAQVTVDSGFTTTPVELPASMALGAYDLTAKATVDGLYTYQHGLLVIREPRPQGGTSYLPVVFRP